MKQWQRFATVPAAAVFFALCLAPTSGLAQSSTSDSQSAKDKERARQAAEQRAREARELQEIRRRDENMRRADKERAAERHRQDADWRREMNERNQRNRAEQPSRSGASSGTGTPPAAGPSAPPPAAAAPRTATTSGSQLGCSAHPVCMATGGRSNLCMGVQSTFSGSSQAGLAEIARRCREANTPDPCAQGARPAAPSYKLDAAPALSCADQCAKVARCTSASSR